MMTALAIATAIAFAVTIGMADAGNASANLAAAKAGSARAILSLAFATHLVGALISGTAVVTTVLGAIDVPSDDITVVLAAGTVAAFVLLLVASRAGLPVSAGLALVAALAGAAWAAAGSDGVVWGGMRGIRPYGVIGTASAVVIAPVLGVAAGALARFVAGRALGRASTRALTPIRGSLWVSSALVGLADGSNDGQKAMAIVVGVLAARGTLHGDGIPMWVRIAVGLALAIGTLLGARVLRTVGRRLYAIKPLDAATAEASSAVVIFASSLVGAPISTTAVVTSGIVGAGVVRRPRHIRWSVVGRIAVVWTASLPVSMLAGAGAYAALARIRG